LIDGYQMLLSQQPSVWSLRGDHFSKKTLKFKFSHPNKLDGWNENK
jgi:hypothetical protein